MNVRFIDSDDIDRALSIAEAVDVLAAAFRAPGSVATIRRQKLALGHGDLLVMAAARGAESDRPFGGVKVVTVQPTNIDYGWPSVQAVYVLLGGPSLAPLALIDGAALTALRTSAVSALATRLLARPDASKLVIFGAGVQARSHLFAMMSVRQIEQVVIVNRDHGRAADLLRTARARGIAARVGDASTVVGADIICTCTTSTTPVFDGALISGGTHVNAIGSYQPRTREIDDCTVRRGRLFVEERAAVLAEAGDLLIPIAEGALDPDSIVGDLSQLCAGVVGRERSDEITVFKSVGLAMEDLAIAEALVRAAPV